jgi:hypothetical protein
MARIKHSARWRPVGAAATFLLAAVAGVAGNQITGHVTYALAVFVVLAVAGVFVTYALDRHADGHDRPAPRGADGTGSGGTQVDLRGARGVQIGDRNRQHNYFGRDSESGPRE